MTRAKFILGLIEKLFIMDEMASLDPEQTGIDIHMYVSTKQGKHGPRIKVAPSEQQYASRETLSISISDNPEIKEGSIYVNPEILQQVYEFIKINKNLLLDFWFKKISHDYLLEHITKYGNTPKLNFSKVDISKYTLFVAKERPGNVPQVKFGIGKDSLINDKTLTLSIETGKEISNTIGYINPKEYNDIKIWLKVHRNLLIDYWNTDMTLEEFENRLRFK